MYDYIILTKISHFRHWQTLLSCVPSLCEGSSVSKQLLVCVCAWECECVCARRGSFRSSDKVHLREGQRACFQRCHGDRIQPRPPGWQSPTRRGGEGTSLQDGNHARKPSQSGPIPKHSPFCAGAMTSRAEQRESAHSC